MGFEALGKKLAQLGQDTKNSVQKFSESYSLNGKISDEKKGLEQLFAQIGEAVFDKAAEGGIPGLEDLEEKFEAVRKAKDTIQDLEEQVQKLKGVPTCPSCGKEAARGEKFCSACGAKLPEVEEPADNLAQSAKEAGNEVGDIVNDAADKARDFLGNVADKAGAFVQGVSSKLNKAEEKAEDVQDAAQETVENAAETAEEAGSGISDAVQEAADANGETASEAAETIMDEKQESVQGMDEKTE